MGEAKHQTTRLERAAYSAYFFGQNIFYVIIATYVSTFLLNMGMSEAVAAVVCLAPQIWDIINDIVFGIIVDKANLKGGKFLPWLKISWIFIPATTLLLFFMPQGMSQGRMAAWVIVAYSLWSVAYTMCDTPIFALSTAMSEYISERTAILSVGRVFATVGAIVGTLGIEALYGNVGWRSTALICSVLSMLCMFPILVLGKERTKVDRGPSIHFKDLAGALVKNKYLLIFYISFLFVSVSNSVQIIVPIFAEYVLGNTDKGTILLAMAMLPAVVLSFFIPALCKKFDKFFIYLATVIIFAAASLLQFFVGYSNEILLDVIMAVRGVGLIGVGVIAYLFTPDCVEYGQYKNGVRQEGICFAIQTFVTKLSGSINNSMCMAILAAMGFVAKNATDIIVNGEVIGHEVDMIGKSACWFVFTIVSAIGPLVALPILILGYKLRDRDVELMTLCNNGEITKADCESRLSRQY
jgi:Na+/melibiose symporter-like transporter